MISAVEQQAIAWHRSTYMSPYSVTRPQCINTVKLWTERLSVDSFQSHNKGTWKGRTFLLNVSSMTLMLEILGHAANNYNSNVYCTKSWWSWWRWRVGAWGSVGVSDQRLNKRSSKQSRPLWRHCNGFFARVLIDWHTLGVCILQCKSCRNVCVSAKNTSHM